MKMYITLILLLSTNFLFGQTLNLIEIAKVYNHFKSTEHKFFVSKGFQLIKNSVSENTKKAEYSLGDKKEMIELVFTQDCEGGEYLRLKYFLKNELEYEKVKSELSTSKFKYSKKNLLYELPSSTYSGEHIYTHGVKMIKEQRYYCIEYYRYAEKTLSTYTPN
jgi:hypothetical protein